MVSTHKDRGLPVPSDLAVRCRQVRRQSNEGNLVFTGVPDPALAPRLFTFIWRGVHGAIADVLRRHYQDHATETFEAVLPRTAEVVHVRWLSPPSINWSNAVAASVTGELEEVLAHE